MRVLLLGEYSNVHWTLAEGLRMLGHEVCVVSNGDFWKNYPRDHDLSRHPGKPLDGVAFLCKLLRLLPKLRGYDVVQLINPMFLELRAQLIFPVYDYLRRHNSKIVLGAFGMDYYWVSTCCNEKPLRYSDFNIGDELRQDECALIERADWVGTAKEQLNRHVASTCHGIVAGLYEYWACYTHHFPAKTMFIPYPIDLPSENFSGSSAKDSSSHAGKGPVKAFIGINKKRSHYKGTDIMLQAAQAIARRYPQQFRLTIAESVPFAEYQHLMNHSDVILDQLYSYTPSMNSLLAMSKGIVCVGGGEPENYEIIHEPHLRPILNVEPTYQSVYHVLEQLVLHPEQLPRLKRESVEYVRRHHEKLRVASCYTEYYKSL